ncbi:hypothetical protein NW766_002243 [Fusarium irregulare]|uniref:Myb-like domain-containing protein n=1 Tax=Fusarium irregulare TaxID=2494466 RepID=A0A9W8UE44_9HYPO|nr:hypothetical protein NW766_002243 [Fusarium irregulare]
MLADKVPRELILVGGLTYVQNSWKRAKHHLKDPRHTQPLPQWTYKSSEDIVHEESSSPVFSNYVPSGPQENEREDVGDAEPKIPFTWGSDQDRYEALSFRNGFIAAEQEFAAKKDILCLEIPVQTEPPAEVAQNRPCTLRILTCIMRKYYESTFESTDGTYSQFWQVLYIQGLDRKWRIQDHERLKSRFEWVLSFIENGVLPTEAQIAENILYKALENVLTPTHPYNFKGQENRGSWLNPDLSPVWVRAFLAHQGCLEEVRTDIRENMPNSSISGFCDLYGIMIASVWEKVMRTYSTAAGSQGHHSLDSESAFPKDQSPSGDLPPGDVLPAGNRPAGDMPASLPSQDKPAKFNRKKWTPKEIKFLQDLLRTEPKREVRAEKFRAKFGPGRTVTAIRDRENKLRRETPTQDQKPSKRKQTPHWKNEEKQYLIKLLEITETWKEVVEELNGRFNNGRTPKGAQNYASKNKLGAPSLNTRRWTDDETRRFKTLRDEGIATLDIAALLSHEFGTKRTGAACFRKATKMGFTDGSRQFFKPDEDDHLRESMQMGLRLRDVADRFWKTFGTAGRSKTGILARMTFLRTGAVPVNRQWSDDEVQFLQDLLKQKKQKRDIISEFVAEFGPYRSIDAIESKSAEVRTRAEKKGAHEDDGIEGGN